VRALQGRTRQAIVTGASREHVNLTHRSTGLLPFFECIITSEDYECAKPHPDAYLAALRRMGIAADEALAIEDSPRGANAALAAGLRCLVIPTPLTRLAGFPSGAQIETDVRRLLDWIEAEATDRP
jgi:beta-phosphoglucomutase-like phosphatase (HAD superfamily)